MKVGIRDITPQQMNSVKPSRTGKYALVVIIVVYVGIFGLTVKMIALWGNQICVV